MTPLESALLEVSSVLEGLQIPYMLIGGLAVSAWGEPRSTIDVDVTLWVEPDDLEATIAELGRRLSVLPKDPISFVRRTRVLPATTSQKVKMDLIFAALPGERGMIDRARPRSIAGKLVMVASVEDLLLMKLASERPKDIDDSRLLLRRFRNMIDRDYIEPRLNELADALSRTDILSIYHEEMRDRAPD
jgi:hypothetical protein